MKLLLSLFFIALLGFVTAQEGIRISYEFEDIQPAFLDAKNELNTMVMNFSYHELEGNNQYSKFYTVQDLRFENRMKQEEEENKPIKQMYVSSFYNGTHYNDFQERVHYFEYSVAKTPVLVADSMDKPLEWQLKRDTKKVLNFTTRMATFEDDYLTAEAWYATELPFKIGPLNYTGLPGAILEMTIKFKKGDPSVMFLEATDVELLDALTFEIPQDRKVISKEEFRKINEEERAKWKEMQEEEGVDISD